MNLTEEGHDILLPAQVLSQTPTVSERVLYGTMARWHESNITRMSGIPPLGGGQSHIYPRMSHGLREIRQEDLKSWMLVN